MARIAYLLKTAAGVPPIPQGRPPASGILSKWWKTARFPFLMLAGLVGGNMIGTWLLNSTMNTTFPDRALEQQQQQGGGQ